MKTKEIVTTAMLLAIAAVLSVYKPFELPYGGGITIASMMPIILVAFCYGTRKGLFAGFVFSLIQMLFSHGTITGAFLPGENQMVFYKAILMCLLDYTLAFTVLGLGGVLPLSLRRYPLGKLCGVVFLTGRLFIRRNDSFKVLRNDPFGYIFTGVQRSLHDSGNYHNRNRNAYCV